jgi:hypothetical protein
MGARVSMLGAVAGLVIVGEAMAHVDVASDEPAMAVLGRISRCHIIPRVRSALDNEKVMMQYV